MRALAAAVLATGMLAGARGTLPARADETGWKLVWRDEFDGNRIDPAHWSFDKGNGFLTETGAYVSGWGNNELEFYTDSPENAFVRGGLLHIRAKKERVEGFDYSSARLTTKGKLAKLYGRIEIRAKLPAGRGIWPALWLLPAESAYGGWAASGEIDMLEVRGQEPNKVLGTLHFGSRWPANTSSSTDYVLPDGGAVSDFHVYALEWEPGVVRWSVDGKVYSTKRWWWSSSKRGPDGAGAKPTGPQDINPWPAPFNKPFYLTMNLAVGGNFLGNPDASTPFPAEMLIDYVRIYDRAGGYGKPLPPDMRGVKPPY